MKVLVCSQTFSMGSSEGFSLEDSSYIDFTSLFTHGLLLPSHWKKSTV